MFGTQFVLEMAVNILRSFLFKSEKAAQFAKYLLRARDYLLLLFPVDLYPENATADAVLGAVQVTPVPVSAVKKAAKAGGFTIPGL